MMMASAVASRADVWLVSKVVVTAPMLVPARSARSTDGPHGRTATAAGTAYAGKPPLRKVEARVRRRHVNAVPLFLTVFVACAVEAVEALTIVLAAGLTRGWRPALQGLGAALAVLAVITAVLGPALSLLPLSALRLVVGALLAAFGLQWLRKAILRYSGYKDLHDETGIYARETAAARAAAAGGRGWVTDWYGFTLSFKGVLLEGLEVVFIAITFGSSQRDVGTAALAAVAAAVVVAGAGLAVRAPLARVPENTLKFAVGVMLTSFGIFWGTEGAGASWPGNDAALLVVVPAVAAAAGLAAIVLRRLRRASTAPASPAQTAPAGEAAR
jgi:uncharacterized membrane protein